MTPFRAALDALAGLAVSGVTAHYALDAVPDELSRGQLPALLVLPIKLEDESGLRLFNDRAGGFEALAFAGAARTVTYTVTHLLLVAPLGAGSGLRTHLPPLIALVDAYFAALGADVTLGGKLAEPAQVRADPGIHTHGSTDYVGCAFRHTWRIDL